MAIKTRLVDDDALKMSFAGTYIGKDGKDGVSPTVLVERTEDGVRIAITDVGGTTEAIVKDGSVDDAVKAALEEVEKKGYLHKDTITDDDIIAILFKDPLGEKGKEATEGFDLGYYIDDLWLYKYQGDALSFVKDKLKNFGYLTTDNIAGIMEQVDAKIDEALGGVADGSY